MSFDGEGREMDSSVSEGHLCESGWSGAKCLWYDEGSARERERAWFNNE